MDYIFVWFNYIIHIRAGGRCSDSEQARSKMADLGWNDCRNNPDRLLDSFRDWSPGGRRVEVQISNVVHLL